VTKHDRTIKGAGIGAAAGAAGAILAGKRQADEILAGAAIGGVIGAGVGAYMDAQQEKMARIPGTTVERVDENTLLVHFENDVLFDVNSAALDGDGRATLDDVAGVLNQYPKTAVVVQGHTDSTGTEEHNQELSERRAGSVRGYLVNRGVDSDRLAAIGYGETYPVASNDSESGRQQNRRVDILLRAKTGPLKEGR
jgi:outer membrane protein OmpA-like peptidoglycan-associated protein